MIESVGQRGNQYQLFLALISPETDKTDKSIVEGTWRKANVSESDRRGEKFLRNDVRGQGEKQREKGGGGGR